MEEFSKTYKYWYPKGNLMEVEVSGHKSKKFKDFIARAVEFYCCTLLTKAQVKKIYVEVIFKKKLEDNNQGTCFYEGKYDNFKEFTLEVAKGYTVRETLQTIAHEMVHLKQFYLGELKDGLIPAHISLWKGVKVNEKSVDYWDLPWEIEAYGRERGLYHRFVVNENKDTDKEFLGSMVL